MNRFSKSDYKTFEQLVKLDQSTMLKVLPLVLQKHGYKNIQVTDSYILAEGDIPVALSAHLDTVFPVTPYEVFYDTMKNVIWSPDGLGADDRAGVFAILQIVKAGYKPHIMFLCDEEIGCIGASKLINAMPKPFAKINFIIELDRQGANDCVFYKCDNQEFSNYIENFGFVTAIGSYSDISVVCPKWGVAGVNLSVGYYDEHSVSEILRVGQLLDTIEKVKHILSEKVIPSFAFVQKTSDYRTFDFSPNTTNECKCAICGEMVPESAAIDVMTQNGDMVKYCFNCVDLAKWCPECGKPFENNFKDVLCPKCRD